MRSESWGSSGKIEERYTCALFLEVCWLSSCADSPLQERGRSVPRAQPPVPLSRIPSVSMRKTACSTPPSSWDTRSINSAIHTTATNTKLRPASSKLQPCDSIRATSLTSASKTTFRPPLPIRMSGMDMSPSGGVCGDTGTATLQSTNVHFHGLNVPPICHQDDVLTTIIQPGSPGFQYKMQDSTERASRTVLVPSARPRLHRVPG